MLSTYRSKSSLQIIPQIKKSFYFSLYGMRKISVFKTGIILNYESHVIILIIKPCLFIHFSCGCFMKFFERSVNCLQIILLFFAYLYDFYVIYIIILHYYGNNTIIMCVVCERTGALAYHLILNKNKRVCIYVKLTWRISCYYWLRAENGTNRYHLCICYRNRNLWPDPTYGISGAGR